MPHASLLEAASLSPAALRRFTHNQPSAMTALMSRECMGETLVMTESIFSMDGDSALLTTLHALT